jgi:hypothetical protein
MSKQAKVKPKMLHSCWTGEALDFVNRLIQRKRHRRLGENGIAELKKHPWFEDFPWKYLQNKIIRPEFVPKSFSDNFDFRNVNKKDLPMNPNMFKILNNPEIQEMFDAYFYRESEVVKRAERSVSLSTNSSTY